MPLSRTDKALAYVTSDMKILEIGPSYGPMVRRSAGWNVFSLDHMDAEGLRQKYAYDPAVDPANIEDVDFVWHEGPLDSPIPDCHKGTFDAIIGSHVIEHFPDLIGFFLAADRILKLGGVVSLVVPDKRFCFDFFQPVPLTGDVLQAHSEKRTRPSLRAAFHGFAYPMTSGGSMTWQAGRTDSLSYVFPNSLDKGREIYEWQSKPDAEYLDVHSWYFTPSSFRLICLELAGLGRIPFSEIGFFDTTGCEFFVTLKKTETPDVSDIDERRMEFLKSMLLEVREQTDFLIEGSNYIGRRAISLR